MTGWTLPTGHPEAKVKTDKSFEVVESPKPSRPLSSDEIDQAAAAAAALELKGEALDQALENAQLSQSGTANEKRARLAEHLGSAGRS